MTECDFCLNLGLRIRRARRNADITQKQLAKKVGVKAPSFICQIERGQKQPSAFLLHKIEKVVGAVWA